MTATERALELTQIAAAAAADKQAADIVAFDVSEQLVITDVFVVCSGANQPQMNAIKDEIERKLLEAGVKTIRREGERDGTWMLLDYGDIVVHILEEEQRLYYSLERIWSDCPTIELDVE